MTLLKFTVFFAVFSFISLGAFHVQAQQVPASEDPGRRSKPFEGVTSPKSTTKPMTPVMTGPALPSGTEDYSFVLTDLRIEGGTIYAADELLPLYKEYLGQNIPLKTIFDIAGAITAKYGKDGYMLSRAVIPQQEIDKGIVRLTLIEGFIDEITMEGELKDQRGLFQDFESKLLASRPLKADVFERYLLLGNDLNGASVKFILKPSAQNHGGTHLSLARTSKMMDGSVSLDNRGTNASGPHQINLSASANNAFGYFGRTTLGYIQTAQRRELRYYSVSHNQVLNSEGTSLSLKAVQSDSTSGTISLKALKARSNSLTFSAEVTHPVIRARAQNLILRGGFTYKNSESFQLDARSTHDRTRVLNLGADYDYADKWGGISQALFAVRKGLPIFHETSNSYSLKTRTGGQNNFTKATLNLSRNQSFDNGMALQVSAMGQWSRDELLSSEECGVGGEQFGRAYDSSEIIGEHCVAASIELSHTPKIKLPILTYIQPYGFYDIGGIWNKNAAAGTDKKASLASTGLGLRFGAGDNVSGSFEVSKPLTRPISAEGNDGDNLQIYFRLTTRF